MTLQEEARLELACERFHKLMEKNEFKPGDRVRYKAGLKNRRAEGPFVVMEALDEAVFDYSESSSGSVYFREPLDIILGSLEEDGDFVTLHYDSRRFEPIP